MCGIVGKIDFSGPVSEELVAQMCAVIEHRGPDSLGLYVSDGVGFGIRRLAIIDVVGGAQPIFNEDRSVVVVMNGEIYNFIELRRDLEQRGHRFRSRSDAEVLVHLYEDLGREMVHRLRGMFAFAIWDSRERRLFCARDRVGKKPFFYAFKDNTFWFASEIRALLQDPALDRSIDHAAIDAYLALEYVPHPLSAFKMIRKLAPASTLTATASGVTISRYWRLDYSRQLADFASADLEDELLSRIRTATRIRLMSEVPLGAFLSGGIDSSAVVASMAREVQGRVKTFSIGFPDREFDELRWARKIARLFDTDHHEFVVEPDALEIMPKLALHYGEPFADPSAIPSFYLAELAGEHVTVALNGDGGDESFAGYRRYTNREDVAGRLSWLPQPLASLAPRLAGPLGARVVGAQLSSRIQRAARILALPPPERYAARMILFDRHARARLYGAPFAATLKGAEPEEFLLERWRVSTADNDLDRMLDTDVQTYLPGELLVKMDIATMAHSVEGRSPLLDHELMEFAAAVPPESKLHRGAGKVLLKRALRAWLPDDVLDRPKMGFGVPLARWFRTELCDLPRDILLDRASISRAYFCTDEIERLLREHRDATANHANRIWALLQLELWHQEVVERPPAAMQSAASAVLRGRVRS
jgi:asparagine synthase (glutamine-hydrolysing)